MAGGTCAICFMLSPAWLFALPAASGGRAGVAILAIAAWFACSGRVSRSFFGDYWVVLAGAMVGVGHIAAHPGRGQPCTRRERRLSPRPTAWIRRLARWVTLETMIAAGLALGAPGSADLLWVVVDWSSRDFGRAYRVLPAVLGTLLITLGAQTVLGGFILAIIGGNEAKFLKTGDRISWG